MRWCLGSFWSGNRSFIQKAAVHTNIFILLGVLPGFMHSRHHDAFRWHWEHSVCRSFLQLLQRCHPHVPLQTPLGHFHAMSDENYSYRPQNWPWPNSAWAVPVSYLSPRSAKHHHHSFVPTLLPSLVPCWSVAWIPQTTPVHYSLRCYKHFIHHSGFLNFVFY